jgi:hypothetical protein
MKTTTARVYEYQGHSIKVSAFNTGNWNAEVVIRGPLTASKPQRDIIGSHVSRELAERAAREWARRWIDRTRVARTA